MFTGKSSCLYVHDLKTICDYQFGEAKLTKILFKTFVITYYNFGMVLKSFYNCLLVTLYTPILSFLHYPLLSMHFESMLSISYIHFHCFTSSPMSPFNSTIFIHLFTLHYYLKSTSTFIYSPIIYSPYY